MLSEVFDERVAQCQRCCSGRWLLVSRYRSSLI